MTYLSTLLFAILCYLLCFSSACVVPQKVIRMEPDTQENVFWYQGQAIAEKKQDQIVTRAAFSHANREYLIFDVEIFNEQERSILVTPEVMTLASETGAKRRAIDPEHMLLSMEVQQSRQEANAANAAIAGGIILVGAAVAVAVSDDGDNGSTESWTGDVVDDYDAVDVVVDAVLPAVALTLDFHQDPILSSPVSSLPLTNEALFWQETVLRRTTLRPGEHIRGLVAFPRFDEVRELIISIPVEQEEFIFRFQQQVIQP